MHGIGAQPLDNLLQLARVCAVTYMVEITTVKLNNKNKPILT